LLVFSVHTVSVCTYSRTTFPSEITGSASVQRHYTVRKNCTQQTMYHSMPLISTAILRSYHAIRRLAGMEVNPTHSYRPCCWMVRSCVSNSFDSQFKPCPVHRLWWEGYRRRPPSLQLGPQTALTVGHDRFPPHHIRLTIHLSSYDSVLFSPSCWQRHLISNKHRKANDLKPSFRSTANFTALPFDICYMLHIALRYVKLRHVTIR